MAKKKEAPKFQVPISTWKPLNAVSQPTVLRQFDGINTMNPFSIKDNHASSMKNLTVDKYPSLCTKPGTSVLAKPNSATSTVEGMYTFNDDELHVLSSNGWYRYNKGTNTWTTVYSSLYATGNKWSMTSFFVDETTRIIVAASPNTTPKKYQGGTVTDLAQAPSGANAIANHDNRLYCSVGNKVYYSALRKAEDWTTVNDSGQINVETSNGDSITTLVPSDGKLTIFKQFSIHELYGTGPTNYQLKLVTTDVGTPYPGSVQMIDGVLYFMSQNSFYRYAGGVSPKNDYGLQVQSYIDQVPGTMKDKVHSWTIGRRYYVSLPINGSTILEYDLTFNTWTVWNQSPLITCNPVRFNDLIYCGDTNGNVVWVNNTIQTDYGNLIEWEWVSKPFTVSSMAQNSTWYRVWVVADIGANATFNVAVSTTSDGDDWINIQSIIPEDDITARQIFIPNNLLYGQKVIRIRLYGTGKVTIYEISRQERSYAIGLQQ